MLLRYFKVIQKRIEGNQEKEFLFKERKELTANKLRLIHSQANKWYVK